MRTSYIAGNQALSPRLSANEGRSAGTGRPFSVARSLGGYVEAWRTAQTATAEYNRRPHRAAEMNIVREVFNDFYGRKSK